MLSKDIEEKYKDSHGREVIPYWRLQDLLKQAKKEVFDDIDKVIGLGSFHQRVNLYNKLKEKHLGEKH